MWDTSKVSFDPELPSQVPLQTPSISPSDPFINMCVYNRNEDTNLFPTPGAFVECYDYARDSDDDSTGGNGCAKVYDENKSWDDDLAGNGWQPDIEQQQQQQQRPEAPPRLRMSPANRQ